MISREIEIIILEAKFGNDPLKIATADWAFVYAQSRPYPFEFFKGGCLPQILSGPFLNTLSHMSFWKAATLFIFFLAKYSAQS